MKKVLIVEDDPFIRDISAVKLGDHGYEVTVAHDGTTALEHLKNETIDIVLLDLDLPDMSGFDLVVLMKANEKQKDIKILVFSNNDDEMVKAQAEELGISGFFTKVTTNYDELFSKIDSL